MSTNKPSIGSVALEIVLEKAVSIFNFRNIRKWSQSSWVVLHYTIMNCCMCRLESMIFWHLELNLFYSRSQTKRMSCVYIDQLLEGQRLTIYLGEWIKQVSTANHFKIWLAKVCQSNVSENQRERVLKRNPL